MRPLLPIFLLAMSSPLAADPPKPAPTPPASAPQRPAVLVLASNDSGRPTHNADAEQPRPSKHRIARVTTCRCGDAQPDAESDSQQQ